MTHNSVWYVNYKKRPSTRKPKRMWLSAHKRFNSEGDAKKWMKENDLKVDRWTNIEKCEIDATLLADIFTIRRDTATDLFERSVKYVYDSNT